MNLMSVLLVAVLAMLVVTSYRRPAVGTIGFLALIPLYYVLRGTSGQSAFAFLWPYLFMVAVMHVFGLRALAASSAPSGRLSRSDRRRVVTLYATLALASVVWSPIVIATFTQPVSVAISQFNDYRIVVFGLLACALVGWPLLTALSRRPEWVRRLTALDWVMVAFLLYGAFQLFVSLGRTRHLFYSLESFRYYFVMASAYFVVRFGITTPADASRVVVTLVATSVLVALEFIVEHYLFNAGVSSLRLPWLRAFDSLFAGYGSPMPVDDFYIMTTETESLALSYDGTRGIGLFMHPHTAGFFMTLGTIFIAQWIFDKRRAMWPFLLLVLAVLVYGTLMTISRAAAMLLYLVVAAVPIAMWWVFPRRFALPRAPAYTAVVMVTIYAAAYLSPGGELPLFHPGWYARPVIFTLRAAAGDLLAWNTPAMAALPGTVAQAATPPGTVAQTAAPPGTVAQAAAPPETVVQAAVPPETIVQAVTPPGHDTASASESVSRGWGALLSKLNFPVLLIGRGFSPLTRYVVDFFPEAAGYRHVSSTADVALLEFFQQFGAIGLGLLLAMFGVFAVTGFREAWRWSGEPAGIISLGVVFVVVVTAVGLLHLYPLFRTGVNTSFYALLGVFGFLHAERDQWIASSDHQDRGRS